MKETTIFLIFNINQAKTNLVFLNCSNNQLNAFDGIPDKIQGHFDCSRNLLTSLKGAPKKVKGDFNCANNLLTSLKGSPKKVKGNFDCSGNPLTTLDGALKKVGGVFICGEHAEIFTEEQVRAVCNVKGNYIDISFLT